MQKRWKNLRDHFSKELKKKKTMKSGSGASSHTPYIYFTRLQFLESCVSNKETINNWEDEDRDNTQVEEREADNEDMEIIPTSTPAQGKKRKALDPVDKQFVDILNKSILLREQALSKNEEDEDKLFCLSLYKELKKVPEHGRIMTKIKLLETIQKAQNFYSPAPILEQLRPMCNQQYQGHFNEAPNTAQPSWQATAGPFQAPHPRPTTNYMPNNMQNSITSPTDSYSSEQGSEILELY